MNNGSGVKCSEPGVASQRKDTGGDKTRKKKAIERIPGFFLVSVY